MKRILFPSLVALLFASNAFAEIICRTKPECRGHNKAEYESCMDKQKIETAAVLKHALNTQQYEAATKAAGLKESPLGYDQTFCVQDKKKLFMNYRGDPRSAGLYVFALDILPEEAAKQPLYKGFCSILQLLKDKTGRAHIFATCQRSGLPNFVLIDTDAPVEQSVTELTYDKNAMNCDAANATIATLSIHPSFEDIDKDGVMDIRLTQANRDCATQKIDFSRKDYMATNNGFGIATP